METEAVKLPTPQGVGLRELAVTPCAVHEMVQQFREANPDFPGDDKVVLEYVSPVISHSLEAWLKSAYWQRSEWFRTTKHHRFEAFRLRDASTNKVLCQPEVVASFSKGRCLLESTMESPLYETYEVDRVLEETRVEIGVL